MRCEARTPLNLAKEKLEVPTLLPGKVAGLSCISSDTKTHRWIWCWFAENWRSSAFRTLCQCVNLLDLSEKDNGVFENMAGIMDYGDGKLNGIYQFNTRYRKQEMCQAMNSVPCLPLVKKVFSQTFIESLLHLTRNMFLKNSVFASETWFSYVLLFGPLNSKVLVALAMMVFIYCWGCKSLQWTVPCLQIAFIEDVKLWFHVTNQSECLWVERQLSTPSVSEDHLEYRTVSL